MLQQQPANLAALVPVAHANTIRVTTDEAIASLGHYYFVVVVVGGGGGVFLLLSMILWYKQCMTVTLLTHMFVVNAQADFGSLRNRPLLRENTARGVDP
jgi:hypothetical protein